MSPTPLNYHQATRGRRTTPIEAEMARDLAEAGAQAREWLARRDALMVQARDQGVALRVIGELVGMSHVGVRRALERIRDGRPAA